MRILTPVLSMRNESMTQWRVFKRKWFYFPNSINSNFIFMNHYDLNFAHIKGALRLELWLLALLGALWLNPNQGGLFGRSIRWGGDQSGTFLFIILIHCQISYKSNENGLIWKLASLFTFRIVENDPFFRSFFVRLPWSPLVLHRNSFRFQ